MLPCISPPPSFLRCLSRTPAPARTLIATGHSLLNSRPGLALHVHSPYTACTHREPAAATHVPARRVDRGHALLCPTGGWRDDRAPSRLPLPVAGWSTTASAPTPRRPSRPPTAAASCCTSSERAALACMRWCSIHDRTLILLFARRVSGRGRVSCFASCFLESHALSQAPVLGTLRAAFAISLYSVARPRTRDSREDRDARRCGRRGRGTSLSLPPRVT